LSRTALYLAQTHFAGLPEYYLVPPTVAQNKTGLCLAEWKRIVVFCRQIQREAEATRLADRLQNKQKIHDQIELNK
jgi:hypothetical protein